jgi:hypothetical protein
MLLVIVGTILTLASIGCWVWVVIEAFRDETWKGFFTLLCAFYWLYYAVFDWEEDLKWPVILGYFAFGAGGAALVAMGR